MGEIPEYKVVEKMRKTHKASKKLSLEDRKAIQSSDSGQLCAVIMDRKVTPKTVEVAAHDYYQKHPELIKPLERLEQLVEAEK